MNKKIISVMLVIALILALFPLSGVISGADTDKSSLGTLIKDAKPYLYKGYAEQTRKLLSDRIERAEAVYYDNYATEDMITEAAGEIESAQSSLREMVDIGRVALPGFSGYTLDDIALMNESLGVLSLDTENVPEGAEQSVKIVTKDKNAVFSNAMSRSSVAGSSPFGVDMSRSDGLALWVSVDSPAVLSVSVGKRSNVENYVLTADSISVSGSGYIYIPFEYFVCTGGSSGIVTDGSMNYVRIESAGADTVILSDLYAYAETLEISNKTQYSETKVMSRGDIEDNAYYKIIESFSGKAVTFGPEIGEVIESWENNISMTDSSMSFTLEDNIPGDRTQMWQLAPSPSGNSSFRLINKSCSNAIEMNPGNITIFGREVRMNEANQEWTLTASGGNFTIQIKGVGKLTSTGSTVKATTSTSFKKFNLYKVVETEYTKSWSDEFNGTELDRSKWNVNDGFYFGGTVSSIHVDDEYTMKFEDGNMVLTATPGQYDGHEIKGTYMSTSGKYAISHGKVEIRAKLAYGNGQFPAFWMMPANMMNVGAGEIDIMEMVVTDDIRKTASR